MSATKWNNMADMLDQKKCPTCGGMNPAGATKCLLRGSIFF